MRSCLFSLVLLLACVLPFAVGAERVPFQGISAQQRKLMNRSNHVYSVLEAAAAGNAEVLAARLKEGADPNQLDELGNRPIHYAARGKSAKVIRLLLSAGADCLARDAKGRTPRQITQHEKVRAFFEKAEQRRKRELAAFKLVERGAAEELKKALRSGVSPHAFSADGGVNLLIRAVECNQRDVVRVLLEAGARVNEKSKHASNRTPLHVAAMLGHAPLVRMLLSYRADPMLRASNGAYALHDALWHRRLEAVKALLPAYEKQNFNPDGGGHGFPINMAHPRGGREY